MNRWLLAAAHKSSGKTTLAIGLAAALRERGLALQPFKKGPDYIDPMWLSLAAGRPCRNLDPHIGGWEDVTAVFARHAAHADACLIEGNHGLHDGMAGDGSDSNAALALRLDLPVILVLDTRGTSRGIAALALGQRAFEPRLRFAGVILNRVSGTRHEGKLRQALERYSDLPVLGAIGEDPRLAIAERHLGLVPSNEAGAAAQKVRELARAISQGVDLDRLLAQPARVDAAAGPVDEPQASVITRTPVVTQAPNGAPAQSSAPAARRASTTALTIGVARDEAFGFYYADDLEALQDAGARLVPVDTLRDTRLPEVDGLFIGGGFPESLAARLQANAALRAEIRDRIEAGLPVYAECGGLMYLARSITWHGERFEMVGAIPADAVMHERPVGRGYVELEATAAHPWAGRDGGSLRAHEFHHSSLRNVDPALRYAYRVRRGHGVDGAHDGIVHRNLLASYAHRRGTVNDAWPARFVEFVRRVRTAPAAAADAMAAHRAAWAA